jgi:hypothetical protein
MYMHFGSSSSNSNERFQGLHSQETSQCLFLTRLVSSWHVPEGFQMEQTEKQGNDTLIQFSYIFFSKKVHLMLGY